MTNYWIVIAIILLVPVLMFYTAFRIIKFISYDPDETFRIDPTETLHIFLVLTVVAGAGFFGTRELILKPEIKSLSAIYCSNLTNQNETTSDIGKDSTDADRDKSFLSYLCSNEFKGRLVEFISLVKIYSLSRGEGKGKDEVLFTTIVFLTFIYAVKLGFFIMLFISVAILVSLCIPYLITYRNKGTGKRPKKGKTSQKSDTTQFSGGQNEN